MKLTTYLAAVLILLTSNLWANGIGIIDGANGVYLQTTASSTTVNVRDQIAVITITQVFRNNTESAALIKYGMPLNENANPTGLRWRYAGEWNEAIVNNLPQNDSIPGGGTGGGEIQPQLREYLGDFPVFFSPNDEVAVDSFITIELTYVELLPYQQGRVSFFQKSAIEALQNSPVTSQSLEFTLISEKEILDVDLLGLEYDLEENGDTAVLNFAIEEELADFDYEIEYELSSEALGIYSLSTSIADSLFSCDTSGNGYFAFIIEPESNVNTEIIEKNFSLIIDRSGSMSGDKIVQAKDAATFIIQNLNPGDFFNIIDFSSDVTSFSDSLVAYDLENESNALSYIDNIESGGSTNISEALLTSINQFSVVDEGKANIIIFCTDGEATAGVTTTPEIIDLVEQEVLTTEKEVFLFTIGIGENVDEALLTLLARENNGLVQFLDPLTLEEDLVTFFLSVNNPVLLNTSITISPDIIEEIYPAPLPNLYKGQQLILSGRYNEAADLDITLEGQAFNLPVTYNFQVSLSDSTNNELSFLPKIWAKQKLDALALDFFLSELESAQDSISNLIDSLSSCYGVIAVEFSSFDDGGTTVEVDERSYDQAINEVRSYPNPFVDQLVLEIPALKNISQRVNVNLMDASARVLRSFSLAIQDGKILISGLGDLQPGIYFLSFRIGDKVYLAKILK